MKIADTAVVKSFEAICAICGINLSSKITKSTSRYRENHGNSFHNKNAIKSFFLCVQMKKVHLAGIDEKYKIE